MKRLTRMTASILFLFSLTLPAAADPNMATVQAFRARNFDLADTLATMAWDAWKTGSDVQQGVAAANLAAVRAIRGDLDGARTWQETARAAISKSGNSVLEARLLIASALVDYIDGRQYGNAEPDEALEKLSRARALLSREDRALDLVEAEMQARSNQGERAQAGYMAFMRLIAGCEAEGDSTALARCCASMARMEGSTGGHSAAERGYQRAYHAFGKQGRLRDATVALRNVGLAQWKQGKLDEARATLEALLARAERANDPLGQLLALNDLSMMLVSAGETETAIDYDRRAQSALRAFAESVDHHGSVVDDVTQIYKFRYVGKPDYLVDLFDGFYVNLLIAREGTP